jgi:hypothetical protein
MSHAVENPAVATDVDKQIIADLQFMLETTLASKELMAIGVQDSLAAAFLEVRTNPMSMLLRYINKFEAELKDLIMIMTVQFFKQKHHLLRNVFQVKREGSVLEYVLVPLVDDLATQFELNDFLSAYTQTQFHERVPVVFHIIPSELVGDLMHVESVDLA